MIKKLISLFHIASVIVLTSCSNTSSVYNMADFGIKPNTDEDVAPLAEKAIEKIKSERK